MGLSSLLHKLAGHFLFAKRLMAVPSRSWRSKAKRRSHSDIGVTLTQLLCYYRLLHDQHDVLNLSGKRSFERQMCVRLPVAQVEGHGFV